MASPRSNEERRSIGDTSRNSKDDSLNSYDMKETEKFDEGLSESTKNEKWESESLRTDVSEHETQATMAASDPQDLERGPTNGEPPNYEERAKVLLWKVPLFCICLLLGIALLSVIVVVIAVVAGLFSAVYLKVVSWTPGVGKNPNPDKERLQLQYLTTFEQSFESLGVCVTCGETAINGTVTNTATKVSADTLLATVSTFILETTLSVAATTVCPEPAATNILRTAAVL